MNLIKSISITLLTITSLLSSCAHIHTKSNTYDSGASVIVNGAKVSSSVKPYGSSSGFGLSAGIYAAGSTKLKGPFKWRIEAEGMTSTHQSMVVHRLKVETSKTGRSEWYDREKLGYRTDFVNYKKEVGKNFAIFQVPGILTVYPEKDGDIDIFADVTITTDESSKRQLIKFRLLAEQDKKETEFIFLPAEIINGFGPRDPREWQESYTDW